MSNRPSRKSSSAPVAHPAEKRNLKPMIIGIAVAVVVIGGAVAIALAVNPGSSAPAFGPVQVAGAPLPQSPQAPGLADPAVGEFAPSITGVNFDETAIGIVDDGEPKVVLFLAHWCPHCQAEVPRIQAWLDEGNGPDDVAIYSVATSTDRTRTNFPPAAWLDDEGWTVPVLVDDAENTAAAAYGVTGFPFFVAVDADGNVVQRTSGELSIAQFEALIEAARTGSPATGEGGPASPA